MIPQSCLRPIKFFHPDTHEYLSVPCGKCDACSLLKGMGLSERLETCFINAGRFRYFFTLTFEDTFLPIARFNEYSNSFVSDCDCDYHGVCYSCPVEKISWKDIFFVSDMVAKYGGLPVLSHRLIINFKKRLRKHAAKILGYYPQFYLFIVGEYGFKEHRPHYHCLLSTGDERFSDILKLCVVKAWRSRVRSGKKSVLRSIGIIDWHRVVSGSPVSYLARYLSVSGSSPSCYTRSSFKPFHQSSRSDRYVHFGKKCKSFQEFYHSSPLSLSYVSPKDGSVVVKSVIGTVFADRYVPRLYRFDKFSDCELVALYGIYRRCPSDVGGFVEYFGNLSSRGSFCPFILGEQLVLNYFIHNDYGDVVRLSRLYYISRRVCGLCSEASISLLEYVRFIRGFYSKVRLQRLNDFYSGLSDLLCDPYSGFTLSDAFFAYSLTFPNIKNYEFYKRQFDVPLSENERFDNVSLNFSARMSEYVRNSCKTHQRNNYFSKHGLRRSQFLPLKGLSILSEILKI